MTAGLRRYTKATLLSALLTRTAGTSDHAAVNHSA